jgi:hypothetical protein
MRRDDLLSREKANRMRQLQASIGRCLREEYDAGQPLPDRLADLVRKIERSTSGSKSARE